MFWNSLDFILIVNLRPVPNSRVFAEKSTNLKQLEVCKTKVTVSLQHTKRH